MDAQFHSVEDDTWSEDTITWNNQPAYGGVLDTVSLTREARDTWRSWDVTSFVRDEFAGDMVASFCLRAAIEDAKAWYRFRSREYEPSITLKVVPRAKLGDRALERLCRSCTSSRGRPYDG